VEKVIYLSYTQGTKINGALLAKSVSAVMVRGGQGIWEDPLFRYNYQICVDNHIPFGIWWFCQPNMMAAPQVEAFLKVWNSLPIKPVVIAYDVEEIDYLDSNGKMQKLFPPSRQYNHDNVLKWCKDIKKATGGKVGIYTRKNYFEEWTVETPDWYQFWMWIAAWYLYTGVVKPLLPWKWTEYKLHQYDGGSLGTLGVDPVNTCKEYFNGDHKQCLEFFGAKDTDPAPVDPPSATLTVPYTATVQPFYLTIFFAPDLMSEKVAWLEHGTSVIVTEEWDDWAKIDQGWTRLEYTLYDVVHQSLENKVSITTPPPPPVTLPVLSLESLDARVKILEQQFGIA
jgi:GH25 family lysozyme M1 (1,4-beta-N-acetylmuramidase)